MRKGKTIKDFLKITADKPTPLLLLEAVKILNRRGNALDLGCGAGRDTKFLLDQGFIVTAIDKESQAEEYIKKIPQKT